MSLLEDLKNSSRAAAAAAAADLADSDFLADFKPGEDDFYNELDEAAACEDVRRMAAALAPQMSDLDEVLKEFSVSEDETTERGGGGGGVSLDVSMSISRSLQEEDDDMDDELQQLAMSEQALREELEFAQDINERLSFSPTKISESGTEPSDATPTLDPPASPSHALITPTKPRRESIDPPEDKVKPPDAYTLQDHADHLQLQTEKVGGWYFCDMTKYLLAVTPESEESSSSPSKDLVKDYCLPIPFRKLKRLYSGLLYHPVIHEKHQVASTPSKTPSTPAAAITTPGPADFLTTMAAATPATPASSNRPPKPPTTPATSTKTPAPLPVTQAPHEEPLPVRTVAIRIRPDVLCGAVMDAIHHAFQILPNNCTIHVLKRQGGHLRAAVYIPSKSLGFIADAQLCTQKDDALERRLILRVYHVQDDPEALNELGQTLQQKVPQSPALELSEDKENEQNVVANRHMKQSCSLIQRLMAAQQQGGAKKMEIKLQSSWLGLRDTAFISKAEMQNAIGSHLESNFKTCPSVREENKKASPTIRRLTLPSLSSKDWPLLDASWTLTSSIMEELDTRDCTYNTLSTLPFGQFPSLPTLDVHYCSQMRRLSRESMITHLLKSAKDLEDYSKGAEYNCALCITILEPMMGYYGIPKLKLPNTSKSLEDYPLEYTPPQVSCPPWGNLVMEALNKIAAKTPTGGMDVDEAVRMVYQAFIKQDDEEQAARLGRKNAQIMERLAIMQAHQRDLVQNIRDSHVYSDKASTDADEYLKKSIQALNSGQEAFPSELQPAVPLLRFRVSVGASSSGTCYVTHKQMLFATTYIPLVGGIRISVYDLNAIKFQVNESVGSTLLNPFPNTMSVVGKESKRALFSFRPSIGPARLHKFLKVIQSFAGNKSPSEFSQVVDNVDVVEEDGIMKLTDTPSEDQLSI